MTMQFVGADGSMGLRHGELYHVEIKTSFCFSGPCLWARVYKDGQYYLDCPYSSMSAFVNNWKEVRYWID